MRPFLVCSVFLLFGISASAQSYRQNNSLDSVLITLYDVISGPPGTRNWDLFKSLFHPKATMGVLRTDSTGAHTLHTFSPDEYIQRNGSLMEKNGFYETETQRETLPMKDMVLIKSSYEWKMGNRKEKGVNALMIVKEDHRWCIYSIIWQSL